MTCSASSSSPEEMPYALVNPETVQAIARNVGSCRGPSLKDAQFARPSVCRLRGKQTSLMRNHKLGPRCELLPID